MKILEYILIGILFILAVNITVVYTSYKWIEYFDSKIELMQQSQYQKNPYLDSLKVKLDSINKSLN